MLGRRRFSSSTNSFVLLGFFAAMLVAASSSAMIGLLISLPSPSRAFPLPFSPSHPTRSAIPRRIRARSAWGRSCFVVLEQATTSSSASSLPEVSSMRAGDIRKELESYGISTKSFLEKKELVEALERAREEGRTPVVEVEEEEEPQSTDEKAASKTSASKTSNSTSTGDDSKSGDDNSKSRDERIASEVEKCKSMKVSELRSELKALGISTRSFFEKSEFVKALAEARVDGVKKRAGQSREQEEEDYDPEYKDVVMKKFEAGKDPRMRLTGDVIDITI